MARVELQPVVEGLAIGLARILVFKDDKPAQRFLDQRILTLFVHDAPGRWCPTRLPLPLRRMESDST